jgi:murein DD-endopeptidase MepM/ murein hydrolase activator NlpD
MAAKRITHILMATAASVALAGCADFDMDLRDLGEGFDTTSAVENRPNRPSPDDRGVISYPTYQVVVARQDDTITSIAESLGLNAGELARYNGIGTNTILRRDEIIALPSRVSEPSGTTTSAPLDVTAIATSALDRADTQTPTATTSTDTPTAAEPLRHRVARGETVYSVARLYSVPVRTIADWNGLGPDLAVREGQFLLIPQDGSSAPAPAPVPVVEPGQGSVTPVPPSAAAPLPDETPSVPAAAPAVPDAPDIGTAAPAPAGSNAALIYPAQGDIIRAYSPGRNEGIDIGAAPGASVKAAAAGEVAAVTTDTSGVPIVVIKHPDNLLTVYTNLEGLSVAKGDSVTRGQQIARVRDADPSFLHFEVRRGLQSVDPADFLP